jgi:tetratricopeptide (TPR) repeat protein
MEISEKLEDRSGIASAHATIASIYLSQGMFDKALEHYHESLGLEQECGSSEDELAICYVNIGVCYSNLHRLDLAQLSYEYAQNLLR